MYFIWWYVVHVDACVHYNLFETENVLLAGLFCFQCTLVRQRSRIVKRGRHVTKIPQRMKAKRVCWLSCNGGQREQQIFCQYFNVSLSRQICTVLSVVLVDVRAEFLICQWNVLSVTLVFSSWQAWRSCHKRLDISSDRGTVAGALMLTLPRCF